MLAVGGVSLWVACALPTYDDKNLCRTSKDCLDGYICENTICIPKELFERQDLDADAGVGADAEGGKPDPNPRWDIMDFDFPTWDYNPYGDYHVSVPPIIDILQPENGSVVSGMVLFQVHAFDVDGEVVSLKIVLPNGIQPMDVDPNYPDTYKYQWNSVDVTNHSYPITVTAVDNSDLSNQNQIFVTVSN